MPSARARLAVPILLLVSVAALTGCATRPPNSPFVLRKGSGPIDLGKTVPAPKIDPTMFEHAKREGLAARAASRPADLPSIEGTDRALRESLAALGRGQTAAAEVRVAQDYWRVKVFDAAFDHFSDAIRFEPRNVTAWEGRAIIWRQWGMTALALSDVHRARYFGPDRPDVLNTLGTILEGAGQCSGAREAYAGALKLDPNADWARHNMARLEHVGPNCTNLTNLINPANPINPVP